MTAVKTFVPATNLATTEVSPVNAMARLHTLLSQLDDVERKQFLLKEFRADIDAIVKHETDVAIAETMAQTRQEQQQRLAELEQECAQQLEAKTQQWQLLLNRLSPDGLAIHIAHEDDLVAIVAEATYRVLTEHLNPTEHLKRVIAWSAKQHIADKPLQLMLSPADFELVKAVETPNGFSIASDQTLNPGDFKLLLDKAEIAYLLSDRLCQLNAALLMARANADS